MSLRLRLTLFASLLVTMVLALSGLLLRQGLTAILLENLDRSLQEALALIRPLLNEENGRPSLGSPEEETALEHLPGDLALALYRDGKVLDARGRLPTPAPTPREGCFTQGGWRFCGLRVEGGTFLAGRPLAGVWESREALDRVLLVVGPGGLLLGIFLGYLLLGRALSPVHRLTEAAQERARSQSWNPLPLPPTRDELRTLAEAFNSLIAALVAALERERRFTQDAAHELRTPLTVLLGRLEQAREVNRDPLLATKLELAYRSAQRLLRLAEDLLHLARAEAGRGLHREPVALEAVVREVVEDLEPLFAEKGMRLEVDLPAAPVTVLGDRTALGMVVRNLLDNTLKFAPGGRVRLQLRRDGEEALLEVTDDGPGFPEEALPHLFERFYQAKVEHRRLGSGLGLAIVAALVHWHGGSVEARNAPGAQVVVRLPLASPKG
ncbi:sensor histidine kinase [Thermus albus]|uniref:sensor histidine kinase n=1 Tax=Thermus albus TaxID=2908146 RepID=UPI001FAB2CB0|nr:HAMP domain-containing sensor histidine kinase [Thermus albus]